MKIAILYDSKYGNTKELSEFLAEKVQSAGHEPQLFRTKQTKPKEILAFEPVAILIGGPTHFGQPARTLRKYVQKLGKKGQESTLRKAAVYNCYTGENVCENIKTQISEAFPQIKILDQSLAIRTGDGTGDDWNKVILQDNWEEEAINFISAFLAFIS